MDKLTYIGQKINPLHLCLFGYKRVGQVTEKNAQFGQLVFH
jgi:hypothetical protein